jgi:hypothetical protein
MIFNVPGHITMIRKGKKTQTRRVNRGIYQVGRDYAVQQKRGVNAERGIRIKIEKIWEETQSARSEYYPYPISISAYDAKQEGGYTPYEYELEFRRAYPNWNGKTRWVFYFLVIEVRK